MNRVQRPLDQENPAFNIGVRLYQKGIKKQEEKERLCKQRKESDERRLGEKLLFRPNLVAKQGRDKSQGGERHKEEELIMYGRMLNEKKEMARVINMQYEESKFDFVPKINKKSEKIVQEKSKYLLQQQIFQ